MVDASMTTAARPQPGSPMLGTTSTFGTLKIQTSRDPGTIEFGGAVMIASVALTLGARKPRVDTALRASAALTLGAALPGGV